MPPPLGAVAASFATSTYEKKRDTLDDWEADYSQDEDEQSPARPISDNVKLWTEANKPKQAYTVIANSSSSAASSQPRVPPVQALANGPALTILKRPSHANSHAQSNSSSTSRQPQKTLSQREKDYEEAKRRIFGETGSASASTSAVNGLSNKVGQMSLDQKQTRNSSVSRSPAGSQSRSGRSSPRDSRTTGSDKVETKPSKAPAGATRAPKGAGEGKGFKK
ncbi:hypothetical protein OIV83_005285 [Microbotryomycetes sp. JL201]|nr:hypothetical protein OIV83_005285 [Microbotryomycetes sp. JL201]